MTVINTNTASMIARDAIHRNERSMSTAMERLSTGFRINSAKDDAAGLAISDRMSAQVSGLNMAVRNANDAISLLQTADGATQEISKMLSRMRELAVQAGSGTYTTTDQAALDLEFGELMNEIDRIAANTEWNGAAILGGGDTTVTASGASTRDYNIQLGAESAQTMALTLNSWRTQVSRDTQMSAASGTGRDGVDPKTGEAQVVTFTAMANGDVFELAGITVTATNTVTAANLEDFFTAQTNSAAITGSLSGATLSGAMNGYSTAVETDGSKVTFTSTGGRNDGKTLASTHPSGTDGTDHAVAAAVSVTGTEGVGAYGQGVLFFGSTPTRINVTSAANASQAIAEIDRAIDGAAAERAKYGSYMSRLQHASDNLQNVATNTAASKSQISDADYAAETTELARTQIISQASTAMLAQANQVKQTVLSLLQ
jgi:flagellin